MQEPAPELTLAELRQILAEQQEQMRHLQRTRLSRRWLAVIAALAVSFSVITTVHASIPDAAGTIHGCILPTVGFLRVIDDATQHCAPAEKPISWNQNGAGGINGFNAYGPGIYPFTVPAGVSHLLVQAWGAGGGGSGADATDRLGGSGGGAGAYFYGVVDVTPLQTYTFHVGRAGHAGIDTGPGGDGGNTEIVSRDGSTVVMRAGGGGGGLGPQSPGQGGQPWPVVGLSRSGGNGRAAMPCVPLHQCSSGGEWGSVPIRFDMPPDFNFPYNPGEVQSYGQGGGAAEYFDEYLPSFGNPSVSHAEPGGDGYLLVQW